MQESPRDIIQDRLGNPIVGMGGWYARACNHPESRVRSLWKVRRAAKKLLKNIDKILQIEEGL